MTEQLVGKLGYIGIAFALVLGGLGVPIPEEAPVLLAAILTRNGRLSGPLAFSTCPYVEVPLDPPAWSAERRDWLLPVVLEVASDGTISPPPGPGLGVVPDLDALEQFRIS